MRLVAPFPPWGMLLYRRFFTWVPAAPTCRNKNKPILTSACIQLPTWSINFVCGSSLIGIILAGLPWNVHVDWLTARHLVRYHLLTGRAACGELLPFTTSIPKLLYHLLGTMFLRYFSSDFASDLNNFFSFYRKQHLVYMLFCCWLSITCCRGCYEAMSPSSPSTSADYWIFSFKIVFIICYSNTGSESLHASPFYGSGWTGRVVEGCCWV